MPAERRAGYTSTRPRGLASWNPRRKTRELVRHVEAVLEEYAAHLPLTVRQVFYRLVGAYAYPKDERAYKRLCEALVRARRAGLIPFEAIRDDGTTEVWPSGFPDLAGFWRAVRRSASSYRRDRLASQPVAVELWAEAGGMVPQLARVADHYGMPVFSSGGFDSLTVKYEAALRILEDGRPRTVLSVSDLDPSGVSIFDAFAEDVAALVRDLRGDGKGLEFRRVAVTREQVERFGLPEAPAKGTDRRGDWRGGTVQAEALAPPDLAEEVRRALELVLDLDLLEETLEAEADEQERLLSDVGRFLGEAES